MRLSKEQVIGAGFAAFRATKLHRILAPLTRGHGAILMLHHVRPARSDAFAPNGLLEITPDFLDAVLGHLQDLGYDFVTMDEMPGRLRAPARRPFAALTFDDGYRDLVDHALPILERYRAPFTAYVTSGFAERTAALWWIELEEALRALSSVDVGAASPVRTETASEKTAAHRALYWTLRNGPEDRLLSTIGALAARAGISRQGLTGRLCLDWHGVRQLARHPLCTIGAHTLTHPMLAKHEDAVVRRELGEGRRRIEEAIGLPVRHLAYPVGDPTSAGEREFAIAAELGFASAVTTRPGMIFGEHLKRLTALPRLSLNGNWQNLADFDILLTGVPFALWNRGRRVA